MLDTYPPTKKRAKKRFLILGVFFLVGIISGVFIILNLFSPQLVSNPKTVVIPKGYSVIATGELLEKEGIIRSALAFRLSVQSRDVSVKSGPYNFSGIQDLDLVIDRLSGADYGDVYKTVTVPEGSTNKQVAEAIKRSSFVFDQSQFDAATKDSEGYLFPDTYSFLPETETTDIINSLKETFDKKIEPFNQEIKNSGRSLEDIIIMASLIEKEATGSFEEKKTVSGILWKRLDEGQLLQVDAPFKYINGVVKAADLRKDGPYNTYTRKGLTPTPIGNPGIDSIKAAINPISSPYYYYLHGKDGVIRYGQNYNQHLNNINRYLR